MIAILRDTFRNKLRFDKYKLVTSHPCTKEVNRGASFTFTTALNKRLARLNYGEF